MSTTQTLTEAVSSLGLASGTPAEKVKSFEAEENYPYKRFLPHWSSDLKLAPLEPFEHVDPGHAVLNDENPLSFLGNATVKSITPTFGVEILDGVDLTALTKHERSQLALYVARKGVVVLRDQQKFIDADPEWQIR